MADIEIKSIEYLRELQHLHDNWQEDAACVCCGWAADEIERLRRELRELTDHLLEMADRIDDEYPRT